MKPWFTHDRLRFNPYPFLLGMLILFSSGTLSVLAQPKEFALPSGLISLTADTGAIEVFFRNLRYNLPAREWNMEIVLENRSFRDVAGPIVVSISSEQPIVELVVSDGRDSLGIPFILIEEQLDNGLLNSGERSQPYTLRVQAGDRAIPELAAIVFHRGLERGYGLGVVQTLDGLGQLLPSVQVTESKNGGEPRDLESDDRLGWLTLGSGAGTYRWKFEKTGYLPVWRIADLETENVISLETPKLPRQSQESFRLSPLNGASHVTSDGRVSVSFPQGAFSDVGAGRLTPLSSQTLPAPLPLGWSPRQAVWVELDLDSSAVGELSLEPWEALSGDGNAVFVCWSEQSMGWEVKGVSRGEGSSALVFPLLNEGAYAVVQADRGAAQPVVPEVGGILGSAVGLFGNLESITAVGEVRPGVVAASTDPQLVTAFAKVTFQHPTEALSSGMRFTCVVSEVYRFTDGSSRRTPVYECSLTAFQAPGDGAIGSLQAVFPMRPQLLIGADELVEATVTVDVKLPEPFEGNVIGPDGGRLSLGNGMRFEALPGLFDTFEAIRLSDLDSVDFAHFETEEMKVIGAFELSMGQSKSRRGLSLIEIPRSGAELMVLARVVSRAGVYGLEPVERFSAGEGTRPLSLERIAGSRLSGIDRSGQYVLLTISERQSLVSGTTTNAGGAAQGGMHVRLGPWSTLSESTGFYRLLSPVGSALLRVLDSTTGDMAVASVEIVEAGSTIELQTAATGPIVVGVDPVADSERVPTIAAITITFSESVNPVTVLNGGVDLIDSNGLSVPVSLSLNSRGNELTLFPIDPLTSGTLYRTRLQRSIADSTGLGLDGEAEFRFTTALPSNRGIGGQLIIYQPGAQALPEEVERNLVGYDPETNPFVIAVHGTQGAADPEAPVIVTNESTGATSTVLSKVDGSFFGFIDGTEDDFVSATYVNQNGSRVYLPVSRQEFDDGFVGLYQQGGILEAESDGGAVQVLVEPGSINDKSKLRLQTVDLLKLLNLLKGVQPEGGGQVLGGMVLSVDGDETPDTRAEISFEIKPESLPLDPGVAPEDATWGLAIPRDYDGVTAYEIIDSMEYVDGRLVTQGLMPSVDTTGSATGLRRLRNGTVTPGGIVSEQLRPPISIGVLFDAISLAQKGSKRVNALDLSTKVLNGLGLPGIGEVIRHQLLLPIMMAQGTSVGIGGIVKAINVDDNGSIDQDDPGDPLAGALIMVDQGPISRRPGKLRPGIMFASSSQKGEYAFNVPVTLDVSGFILTATHPRYPFQIASGGATIGSLADRFGFGNFANVPLFFAKGSSFDVGPSGDTIEPLIRAAHDPVLPTPGDSNEAEGVVLTVVGIDNGTMATVGVVAKKVINLSSGAEETLDTVLIEDISEGGDANSGAATTQANSLTKRFRIKSQKRARVTLEISAVDSANLSSEVPYLISFGGQHPQITPEDPNDDQGPRLLFSWPPEGAAAVQPGKPIVLHFSESLAESNFSGPVSGWLTFESHNVISAEPSKDFKQVVIHYSGTSSGEVKLSVSSTLVDRNGQGFDQDPDQNGDQAFNLGFRLAGSVNATLPEGPVSGGGVVFHGAYAFAIEREGEQDGAVFAYDLSDPASPERVGTLSVPGYPTSLAMLPDYSMQLGSGGSCGTGDYLAVAGGRSEFEGPPKYLWIIDVSDPTSPRRVTGAVITFSDTARVNGMQWSPPFLGLQISEGDITFLQVINVPEMVYGLLTPEAEAQDFPASGGNGVDANRDGDYCDAEAGDLPPIPSNRANQLFGMVVTLSPENPKERILDFAIDADSGVIGVVYRTADVGGGSGYRTLFAGLEPVDGATAKVDFGVNDFPKRLVFLPGTAVEEERNGETTINFKNLALVSIAGQENRLALIDLTNPAEPSLIHYISLPPDSGVPQSVKSRGDGFVVVATGSKLLLLDPTKLLKADGPEGHPAFVGPLASIGSNTKKYVSDTSGVNITSSGGNSRLSVTSPQIQLLSFPDEAGSIDDILALTEVERAALLLTGRESEFLVPVKLASPAQSTNVTAATSYYVFVNAPGGFGSEIPMSLVSLTRSGKLLPRSSNSEMPRFLTDEASYGTLTGVTNMNAAATVSTGMGAATGNSSMFDTDIIVKRLSGDSKSSVFYNTYLGGPVVLTRRNLEQEDVTGLGSGADGQRYLKAGAYLWAGLAPKGYSGSLSITNFTSNVVDEKILPGASSLYRVARPRNPLILIHGVAGSHLEINADAAGVSFINELRAKVFSELWPGYHIFDNALQNINIPILPTVAAYTGYAKLLSLEGVDLDSDQELTVVPSDIIRQIPERYNGFLGSGLRLANVDGLEKVYAPLIDYITDDLGYIEYQHGKFNDSGTLVSKSNGGFNANEMHKLRVAPSDDTAPATGDGDSSEGDNNRQRFDDYIHTQVSKHPDFFIFVYDWRLSNVTSAKKLEEFLELVELFHPDLEKVDIVAHSMGGLVARRFIMNHPEKVDKLITLGAPFLGAPKSILTLETGQFLDSGIQHAVIISKKSMRNLAKFFPGAHQLIPFSKYFELEPDAFVEQGWDYNRSGSAYDTFEFSDFQRALDTVRFAGVASTPASESDTFNTAVVTPMTMDGQPGMSIDQSDWSNDPTDVDYYHIYGVQAAPRTIGKIKATRRIRPSLIDTGYFTYREELEVGYVKGDGTVPLISASRMATGGESAGVGGGLNASDAVRIPLVATDDSSAANKLVDHNGMLGNPVLHRTVGTILNEEFEAPTSGVSGSSTVVTTVRIINADRSTVRILDDQGSNLPARVLATLEVAELTGEGDAPPAQFASLQREQFDDHYGVQIYEVDPFVVANSDGSIPARDDEGDGKSDVVEIVTYGEDFQISLEQSGSPVSVRIEQERDGVVERLLIWNEIDDADIPDEEIAPMGLVRRRLDRQMVAGSSNAILISTPDTFEEVPTLKIKRMSDAMGEGDNTVVDGVPVEDGTTEYDLAADTQFQGEAARDQTAESAIICSAFNRNTEFRFFLGDGASGAFVEGARFYFSETDPGLNADLAKLTPLQDENVLNIEQVLASVSGDSVWVVGEDPSKNIANTAPLKVHLVTVTWDISGTHETAQSVVPRGENDWAGMLVYDRPPLDSDTDEDGSAFTPPLVTDDLAEVSLSVIPEGLDTGTVELALETDESRIKVYADPEKMEELTFPLSWDLVFDTVPEKLYIEGFKFSEEVDDVRLKLSYVGTDSQNLDSKLIESQLFLTVPQIVVEPINSDTVEAVNASGIVMGQRNEFRCLVNPVTIPEESIVWSSVNGRVSFILDTGRRVFVAGSSEGEDSLVVGIEGFMGPAPRIDLHVFQSVSEVDVRAFIVARSATGEGAVIRPNEIPDMLAAVSEYYDHVGIEFRLAGEVTYLASPHYTVTGGENWMDVDTNNSFAVPRSIWSTESNTRGIEMYFVRTIDGGLTKGLNRSAGTVDSGILVATRDRIPRRPAEPNDPILTPAQVALEPEDDTLEDAQLYPATVAHELGHACGFVDLYTSRAFPTWGVETEFSPTAPPRKEWIPFDWGSSSEQFSYYPHDVNHVDLIQRLLMHGVLIRGELRPLNTDIPFGYVFASFLVGEESTGIAAPLPVRGQGSVGIKGPGDFRINRSPEH